MRPVIVSDAPVPGTVTITAVSGSMGFVVSYVITDAVGVDIFDHVNVILVVLLATPSTFVGGLGSVAALAGAEVLDTAVPPIVAIRNLYSVIAVRPVTVYVVAAPRTGCDTMVHVVSLSESSILVSVGIDVFVQESAIEVELTGVAVKPVGALIGINTVKGGVAMVQPFALYAATRKS